MKTNKHIFFRRTAVHIRRNTHGREITVKSSGSSDHAGQKQISSARHSRGIEFPTRALTRSPRTHATSNHASRDSVG
jgi:hypothetical protein